MLVNPNDDTKIMIIGNETFFKNFEGKIQGSSH